MNAPTRRLAAILAADVAGYSRLMAADEVGTLAALKAVRREVMDPSIAAHHGRIVKTTGDGMLVEFASAVDAVTCAAAVQEEMASRGGVLAFRIGINVGDIIFDDDDIFGDGVNVAARVENECEPGAVYLSAQAFDQVRNKTKFSFNDLGERTLKNIDGPIRVYAVRRSANASADVAALPQPGTPLALPDKPSIAVLPFQNMSGDPEQEYFADGMVEDIITALSRFKSLFVIARNSSFTYKGKPVDIKQVGRELGVRYVLEGSVRKAGNRVRITGQLIEAANGTHLWADRFDGALEDVFDLQDRVTQQVVNAATPAVRRAEIERANLKRPDNLDAYDLFLKASACLRPLTPERNREGLDWAYKAIALAPDYGAAYSLAAYFYTLRNTNSMKYDREKDIPEALRLARRALALADDDPEVLVRAGLTIGNLSGDVEANSLFDRAITLNPNLAEAWHLRGAGCLFVDEPVRAIEFIQRAMRISPLDPSRPAMLSNTAGAYIQLEQFDTAYEIAEQAYALKLVPFTARYLIVSAVRCGKTARAREVVAKLLQDDPDMTIDRLLQGVRGWRGQVSMQRMFDGLREAGVPE